VEKRKISFPCWEWNNDSSVIQPVAHTLIHVVFLICTN
jgi:hypothetical protein